MGWIGNSDFDLEVPVVGVGEFAVLDALDGVVEFFEGRAAAGFGTGLVDDAVALDRADRGHHHRGAAGRHFGEAVDLLLEIDGTALDRHAHVGRDLAEGHVRDGREDGRGVGGDVLAVLGDAQEVGGGEFFDVGVGLGVEVEFDGVAGLRGFDVRRQARAVVAAALDVAGAHRGRAVVVVDDDGLHGLQAALVVGAHRGDEDDEGVFLRRRDADLRGAPEQQRADVQGAAGAVGRDVVGVGLDDAPAGVDEHLGRHGRHADALGGVVHALGVLLRAEEDDVAVLLPEGFHAFEGFLPVVQGRGRDVDGDVRGFDELAFVPFAVFPGVLDVATGLDVGEAQGGPVEVHGGHGRFLSFAIA